MTDQDFEQIFPTGAPNYAFAEFFTGQSFLAPLVTEGSVAVSNVTFEPGCRNNWHIHHGAEQVLLCTAGEGWYQADGEPAQRLTPGSVVTIPAELKHWHGATADSWFSHVALMVPKEGASNEWLEPVSDEEYAAL